jgi:hypothetical protein
MSRFISKKRALLTAAVTSLALVAVAVAFYTTAGSGSGSGTTAANYASTLTITGSLDDASLVPGGTAGITGNVHNPNSGSAKVSTVEGDVTAATGGCDISYFTIADKAVNAVLAGENAGTTDDQAFTTTISMSNSPTVNQDACKGSTLTISWSSAQS